MICQWPVCKPKSETVHTRSRAESLIFSPTVPFRRQCRIDMSFCGMLFVCSCELSNWVSRDVTSNQYHLHLNVPPFDESRFYNNSRFCLSFIWTYHMTKTMPKQCQNNPKTQTRRQTMQRKEPRLWWRWDNRGHAMSRHCTGPWLRTKVFEAGEGFAFGETALLYNVWWPRPRGWQPMNTTLAYVSKLA